MSKVANLVEGIGEKMMLGSAGGSCVECLRLPNPHPRPLRAKEYRGQRMTKVYRMMGGMACLVAEELLAAMYDGVRALR